jgi:hypothetical protein
MLRTWIMPICLSAIAAVGLISALIGDGAWDVLSWVALAIPAALCLYHALRSMQKKR